MEENIGQAPSSEPEEHLSKSTWLVLALAGALLVIGLVSYYLTARPTDSDLTPPPTGEVGGLSAAEQVRVLESLGDSTADSDLSPAEQVRVLENLGGGAAENRLTDDEQSRLLEGL